MATASKAKRKRAVDGAAATGVPTSNDPATADDATLAAALAVSPRTPIKKLTSANVDLLAGPQTQRTLRALAPALGSFKGCDVEEALALVAEGAVLNRVADRLENSTARVRRR